MKQQGRTAAMIAAWLGLCVLSGRADDWPHWRGLERTGVVRASSGWHAGRWLPSAPAWTGHVGAGSTSPLVVEGCLYTMGWRDGADHVYCLDAATGAERWRVSYAAPEYGRFKTGDEGFYSGPSSTPEFDPTTGYLYTLGSDGGLHCWDTRARGRKVWGLNLYDQFGVRRRPKVGRQALRDYGYTSSPLVERDWLIVEVGAPDGTLMAFAKRSGARAWVSACRDPAGHNAGPVPLTVEGIPCVAVLTTFGLCVVRTDAGQEGRTLAEHPWVTDFANNIASPAVQGNEVLVTSAYNHNSICKLRITRRGAAKVWEQPYPSKVCTPVIHQGRVYFAWQALHCLDWETGQLQWRGGQFSDPGSCIVTGDGRVIVWGRNGKLVLAEGAARSPRKYTELAGKDHGLDTQAWPHVVLADGRLYGKDRAGRIFCYRLGRTGD